VRAIIGKGCDDCYALHADAVPVESGGAVLLLELPDGPIAGIEVPAGQAQVKEWLVEVDADGRLLWQAPMSMPNVSCIRLPLSTNVHTQLLVTDDAVMVARQCHSGERIGTCMNSPDPNCEPSAPGDSGLAGFARPRRPAGSAVR
jgi:hypothetical protein